MRFSSSLSTLRRKSLYPASFLPNPPFVTKPEPVVQVGRRRFCARPFQYLEIVPGGRAHMCCMGWLPTSIGNVNEVSIDDLWNGPVARAIRRSTLDNSFRYCTGCPHLTAVSGDVHYADEVSDPASQAILAADTEYSTKIRWLNLAYDRTCNLSCPTCRQGLVVLDQAEARRAEEIQARLTSQNMLHRVEWICVTGSGDPFASPRFRTLLRGLDPAFVRWLERHGYVDERAAEDRGNEPAEPSAIEGCKQLALAGGTFLAKPGEAKVDPNADLDRRERRFSATCDGFDVPCAVRIEAADDVGRERLVR